MTNNLNLELFLNLNRAQSILVKRFDSGMGNGIAFNEFLILYYLDNTPNKTMRRIDLAEKVGLTASGITRMLIPMEKIGLITSGSNDGDARVKSVILSVGGQEKLDDALERFQDFITDILTDTDNDDIKTSSKLLLNISAKILLY